MMVFLLRRHFYDSYWRINGIDNRDILYEPKIQVFNPRHRNIRWNMGPQERAMPHWLPRAMRSSHSQSLSRLRKADCRNYQFFCCSPYRITRTIRMERSIVIYALNVDIIEGIRGGFTGELSGRAACPEWTTERSTKPETGGFLSPRATMAVNSQPLHSTLPHPSTSLVRHIRFLSSAVPHPLSSDFYLPFLIHGRCWMPLDW